MRENNLKLIVLSAPSGAGKTTIAKALLNNPQLNLMFSISATSRPPRPNEKNGVDYYFLSTDEFKNLISKNAFVEYEEVYENVFYGTLKSEIERINQLGKNILFDVDVKGALSLKKHYGNAALLIFIMPPSIDELKNRLQHRNTETPESLSRRIQKAQQELTYAQYFDVIIINDDINRAIDETTLTVKNFIENND